MSKLGLKLPLEESSKVEDGLKVTEDFLICRCFYGHFSGRY